MVSPTKTLVSRTIFSPELLGSRAHMLVVTDWINETSKNWLKKMEKLGSCYVLEIEHGGKTSIYEVFSTPRYPHPGAAMIVKIEYSDNNSFTQDFKKNYSAVAKLPGPTLKRNTVYLGVFRIKHKNSVSRDSFRSSTNPS